MTMANERTRAVIHTREFLEELSRDTAQTESIRKTAVALLRHYPSDSDILLVGKIQERYAAMSIITPIFSSTIEQDSLPQHPQMVMREGGGGIHSNEIINREDI